MSFLEELKNRLESTRKQWEKANKEAREAKERASELFAKLTALQRVYDSEAKGSGKQSPTSPIVLPDSGNKAEFVRELIRRNPGLKPSQIREALRASGVETNDTYVYSVLLRAKRAGHIREEKGKYFVDVSDDMQEKAAS